MGLVSQMIFARHHLVFTASYLLGCVAVPARSLLYVADLLVLSSMIYPSMSSSIGGSLLQGWLRQD